MAEILEVDGQQWLLGMHWSSYEHAPRKAELLADAERLASDWVAVRITEATIEAGFCAPVDDQFRPNQVASLAAYLADSQEQPWLGTFDLGGGLTWYLAVRDGHSILPRGDIVGRYDDLYKVREEHAGFNDWHYVDGDLAKLADLIATVSKSKEAKNKGRGRRTPVYSLAAGKHNPLHIAAVTTAIAAVAIGGLVYWHFHQEAILRARRAALHQLSLRAHAAPPPLNVHAILVGSPTPEDFLASCGRAIEHHHDIVKNGWLFAGGRCAAGSLTVRWVRGEGATVSAPPPGTLDLSGESSTEVIPLEKPQLPGPDSGSDLRTEVMAMRAWAQNKGLPITLRLPSAGPSTGAGASASSTADHATVGANEMPVSLTLPLPPYAHTGLDQVPGLRLQSVEWGAKGADASAKAADTSTGWLITGVLYVR
jgi:hypothetical protein